MDTKNYFQTFQDVIVKMKYIQSVDMSVLNTKESAQMIETMKEYLLASDTFTSSIRGTLNIYYTNALKETMEKEKMLKNMLSSIQAPVALAVPIASVVPVVPVVSKVKSKTKTPIVKVKEYVTQDFEKRGFKCNEITGLPEGLEPWYGHHIEHGRILHKRLNAWLDMKDEQKKKEKKEAKKGGKNMALMDASNALLSL